MNELETNIKQFTNEKLCEIVVSNRYLGVLREEAILCMGELATRRAQGDMFAYESKIDELLETLPKINIDLKTMLKNSNRIL